MRRHLPLLTLVLAAFAARPAFAQDNSDTGDLLDGLDDLPDATTPAPEPTKDGSIQGPDDLDSSDEPPDTATEPEPNGPTEDLLGGDQQQPSASGDTADVYRAYAEKVGQYDPDEEVSAWERYLLKFPNTPFRQRIEDRIQALMDKLYSERIDTTPEKSTDALQAEIPFSQALLLENINPRSRLQFGFEWGLPNWINLYGGYEHAFARNFSVQGEIRHRYTGWSVEGGVRWAPVKSLRTQTLVTFLGDVRFNTIPSFLAVRPQIAAGKIFAGIVHAQIQIGTDIELRNPVGVHLVGGANVTVMASDAVALFVEGNMDLKNLTWKAGRPFAFNTATFGIKFFPKSANMKPKALEANVGASLPVGTDYWQYHYGSVMAQANYYFPEK